MAENKTKFLDTDRTSELWTAIKTQLAGKVDLITLQDYATTDAVATAIVTALTEYAKDSEVTAAITTALADYMTTSEVNQTIVNAVTNAGHLTYQVVSTLPETGEPNVIYLVPIEGNIENNAKNEYMWVDNAWELIGSTTVNLTNYWSKDSLRAMTAEELAAILI